MSASNSSGCYVIHKHNQIEQWSQSPCGDPSTGPQACCQYGQICVGSSICRFTGAFAGSSGYYTGGCTDKTFKDAACLGQCGTLGASDIVFNSSTGLWACCSRKNIGGPDCSVPLLDTTFQAPSPQDLKGTFLAPLQGQPAEYPSTSDMSSTQSTSSTAASATPPSSAGSSAASPTPSGGLSGGQKAGIGVGGAIAWFSLMALLYWFWWRRRRGRKNAGFEPEKPSLKPPAARTALLEEEKPNHLELDSKQKPYELDSAHHWELDSRQGRNELAS
ncbi:MAG: hypothetical protein Q9168_007918 [Polycauliona sp. 1 TL-2023]